MDSRVIAFYIVIAIVLAGIDFHYCYRAFQMQEPFAKYLGFSALAAAIVTLSYMCSIQTENYLNASISSSIYFIGIDWMLVSLVHFVYSFTQNQSTRKSELFRRVARGYALFDTVVMLVNIFVEIAVHYVREDRPIAFFSYEMKPLYVMHLVFTYILVAATVCILIYKTTRTPHHYRMPYILNVIAIASIVLINAVFLFPEGDSPLMMIDHSVVGYSLGLYLMFWAAFEYRRNDMLKSLSMTIFQNIDQGIVLFDYTDELIMYNKKAELMLGDGKFHYGMPIPDFLTLLSLPNVVHEEDRLNIQLEVQTIAGLPLRCDYSRLRERQGAVIGNLFVLTESSNSVDLMTGFQQWEFFQRFCAENPYTFDHPSVAVTFDITGLGEVNRTFGRGVGDQRIRNLAKVMRDQMPENTYFVRGYEAHLIAVCVNATERDIRENVEEVLRVCRGTVLYGMGATADSSISGTENRNIINAVEIASKSLQVKKLLNSRSAHSQTLTSLVRALQEADSDTEAHVKRTQKMGAMLGERIGLCDSQQADLSLLCLLHDIGKIGVPLEILNKPGKLTDEEWAVLRTHTEKGYQIAMSSDELSSIAEMILCHHEQWDGKGYPNHISGENIPILSRVIAVVDSYDAMVNNRSYRKSLRVEQAKAEICRCAGTQYDPHIAEEFLKMLEENPEIAVGESVGGEDVKVFQYISQETPAYGNTKPVTYSRYVLDLDENIVEVDSNFTQMTGYFSQEVVGRMSQYDLVPPEDRSFYMIQVNNQFSHGSIAFLEHELLRKDGTKINVICFGKHYYDSALKEYRSEILITQV